MGYLSSPHHHHHHFSLAMITDVILLLILFGVIGGIFLLVSSAAPSAKSTNNVKGDGSAGVTGLGRNASIDWEHNEFKLRTNMRPRTQEEILDSASEAGREGGKFMSDHKDAVSFGKMQ